MSFLKKYEHIKASIESQPALVGEALHVIRDHQGDSIEEAAKKCGIEEQLLRDVEVGRAPREAIDKVLQGYDIPGVMAAITQVNTLLASYGAGIRLTNQLAGSKLPSVPALNEGNILDNIPMVLMSVREYRKMSQVTLARQMTAFSSAEPAITQGYISKVESGSTPITLDRLKLFTEALGCPAGADNLVWLIEQFQMQQKVESAAQSKS